MAKVASLSGSRALTHAIYFQRFAFAPPYAQSGHCIGTAAAEQKKERKKERHRFWVRDAARPI